MTSETQRPDHRGRMHDRCTVCQIEWVDAEAGYDTCEWCLRRMGLWRKEMQT